MLPCASSLSPAEPDWAAFAAIDWASRKHAWSLAPVNGGPPESGILDNTPEAVELWAMALHHRFAARPIAISIEQKRGAVIYLLAKYAHFVLYPVPPSMAASYRQAFFPSGAKNDPGDAGLLLEILLHHRQRLRPRHLESPTTRLLQLWSNSVANLSSRGSSKSSDSPIACNSTFPSSACGSTVWIALWLALCSTAGPNCHNSSALTRAPCTVSLWSTTAAAKNSSRSGFRRSMRPLPPLMTRWSSKPARVKPRPYSTSYALSSRKLQSWKSASGR